MATKGFVATFSLSAYSLATMFLCVSRNISHKNNHQHKSLNSRTLVSGCLDSMLISKKNYSLNDSKGSRNMRNHSV